jgi:hypothetical protein
MEATKKNCMEVYFIDGIYIWRNTELHKKMIEKDTQLLNNISKRLRIFFVSPLIYVAIQMVRPMPCQANSRSSSEMVKIQDKREVYFREDKTETPETPETPDSGNKERITYIDQLNGHTYTKHFTSIDYRHKPITVANKKVLLKPVSAEKLYKALAFLDQALSPQQVAIKEVFTKKGVPVGSFDILCKFNSKTSQLKIRGGDNTQQNIQTEQITRVDEIVDNSIKTVDYGTILTNVLLVVLSALLLGIIVLNVVDMLATEDSDPVKYSFTRSMYQHLINLNRKEIGHIGYIAKLLGDFCTAYPKIELAPTEAINRMCQDYLIHFERAIKIKKDITKLIKRNAILSETSKDSQRIYDAYMLKFLQDHT